MKISQVLKSKKKKIISLTFVINICLLVPRLSLGELPNTKKIRLQGVPRHMRNRSRLWFSEFFLSPSFVNLLFHVWFLNQWHFQNLVCHIFASIFQEFGSNFNLSKTPKLSKFSRTFIFLLKWQTSFCKYHDKGCFGVYIN